MNKKVEASQAQREYRWSVFLNCAVQMADEAIRLTRGQTTSGSSPLKESATTPSESDDAPSAAAVGASAGPSPGPVPPAPAAATSGASARADLPEPLVPLTALQQNYVFMRLTKFQTLISALGQITAEAVQQQLLTSARLHMYDSAKLCESDAKHSNSTTRISELAAKIHALENSNNTMVDKLRVMEAKSIADSEAAARKQAENSMSDPADLIHLIGSPLTFSHSQPGAADAAPSSILPSLEQETQLQGGPPPVTFAPPPPPSSPVAPGPAAVGASAASRRRSRSASPHRSKLGRRRRRSRSRSKSPSRRDYPFSVFGPEPMQSPPLTRDHFNVQTQRELSSRLLSDAFDDSEVPAQCGQPEQN
jgi:outer membrane murein-binding lipoprotein Lpp